MTAMFPRKTTPKVRDGRVQRKDRASLSPDYFVGNNAELVIDRQKPGEGFKHFLKQNDIKDFIALLPDWPELSRGLHAIVLAPGDPGVDGWHTTGVVGICAWDRNVWVRCNEWYHYEHQDIFQRLGVPCEKQGSGYICKFTEHSVRAFQLLHILLHELGHHHDRMTTKSKKHAGRGEGFAEDYARRYEAQIFETYAKRFPLH
ncbi:MAG: hypothetical protein AB1705_08815 [Verrucomicrobiota bacterium]